MAQNFLVTRSYVQCSKPSEVVPLKPPCDSPGAKGSRPQALAEPVPPVQWELRSHSLAGAADTLFLGIQTEMPGKRKALWAAPVKQQQQPKILWKLLKAKSCSHKHSVLALPGKIPTQNPPAMFLWTKSPASRLNEFYPAAQTLAPQPSSSVPATQSHKDQLPLDSSPLSTRFSSPALLLRCSGKDEGGPGVLAGSEGRML